MASGNPKPVQLKIFRYRPLAYVHASELYFTET